jgi:hypothetical protein
MRAQIYMPEDYDNISKVFRFERGQALRLLANFTSLGTRVAVQQIRSTDC